MTRKDAPPPAERLAEIRQVTDRARAGDPSAVPRLIELLDEFGYLATFYGDLGVIAATTWVALIAGSDLLLRESLAARVDAMRKELGGENPGAIVELAVDRVLLTWLSANHACAQEGMALDKGESLKSLAFRTKRRIEAERAHLRALAALATLQKLSPPGVGVSAAVPSSPAPVGTPEVTNRLTDYFADLPRGKAAATRDNPVVRAN